MSYINKVKGGGKMARFGRV